MALADDICGLRDRVVADLNAAHDYFTDTKTGWDIVADTVGSGHTFAHRSAATGTVTTQTELVNKARGYVAVQLTQATFQQFLSIFENFFVELLRLWLLAYPQSLFTRKVDLKTILDAPDKEAITLAVINKELSELFYDRPAAWFAFLEDRAKLGCPTAEEIARLAEAKASRDVLIHNRGVANALYEAKAGTLARYRPGQRIDIPEPYHRETWELLRKVIADIANAAITKVP